MEAEIKPLSRSLGQKPDPGNAGVGKQNKTVYPVSFAYEEVSKNKRFFAFIIIYGE